VDRRQFEATSLKSRKARGRPDAVRRAAGPGPDAVRRTAGAWGGDHELEAGSRAHYDDAAYYSKTYDRRTDDVAFYVELAKERGGTVLEYGVGNGRIGLPLARAGLRLAGVDLSRPMLDDFEARLAAEPADVRRRVTLRQGDMRHLRLGRRFDLVFCPFNAFLHLYSRDDVERFLGRVHRHLAPRGAFIFDVSLPNASELVRDPNRAYHCPRFRYPSTGEMVRYTERFDYDALRQILFVSMEFFPEPRPRTSWMTPLAHRQFFPSELEALLHYNGFAVDEAYGDYKRGRLDRYSEQMIFVCRPRRGRAGRRA
jgi:SAM-dependent methyltransferase